MSSALATIAPRLGQLVRLLGSDQPGEVVAAAAALKRTLASVDQDFHTLARVIETSALSTNRGSEDHRAMAHWLIKTGVQFTPRERDFLHSMANWRSPPSAAQIDWLQALFQRASAEGRRA
jgi:hypothetical protein